MRDHLDELEILDDTYFLKDRETTIKSKYDTIIEQVESEFADHGKYALHNDLTLFLQVMIASRKVSIFT